MAHRGFARAAVSRSWRATIWAGVFLSLALLAVPVRAADPPAPVPAAVSADELDRLVQSLQDDKARAQLVAQLKALIAAQRQQEQSAPAQPATVLESLSARLSQVGGEVLAGAAVLIDAPRLLAWAQWQATDPEARARWLQFTAAVCAVFGAAVAAEWLVRLALTRLRRRAAARTRRRGGFVKEMARAALAVFAEALPIVAFAAAAETVLPLMLAPATTSAISLSIVVQAAITARLVLTVARVLLVSPYAEDGIVWAGAETRAYLHIWVRRFTCWFVFGYAVPKGAWWLGVPGAIYGLMLNTVGFVLSVLGIVFVLQNRRAVAAWIAGPAPTGEEARHPGWRRLRRGIAELWHVIVIAYIAALYLVYALRIEGGFTYVMRATCLSLVIALSAHVIGRFVRRLSARGFAIAPDLALRFPNLEKRANRYLPVLIALLDALVYAAAFLAILQAWDVRSFAWFDTELGRRIAGAALSIAAVVGMAAAAWEIVAAAIERQLANLDAGGAAGRSRRRTLLPLLRTAMLCVILVIAALTILSQVGINIAPLLAGAGIVGLAIGFGSQALVKDVITGLFILLEDQIAVGDVVDLGKEHSGVVEAITVRTVRLRDQGGVVHAVPFGEVTTVKNLTKDFANVVAKIPISYREDIDRVVDILRGVSDELAKDEALGPLILDPFDYQGVDSLDQAGVTLLLRIRTLPKQQWVVGRAFNRLVKIAFEKNGVAMRDPNQITVTALAEELAPTFERRRA